MKRMLKRVGYLIMGAVLFCGFAFKANAQTGYKISAPYSYKNLTVFLIYGKDEIKGGKIMTLQEAMERKLFVVYETGNVNELAVENLSKDYDVFIQSGDIVKGGKQDRVLAISIIIPARSGRVLIEAYCVEQGRWQKRGKENVSQFESSNDRIVSKKLKVAANQSRSQSEVWNEVAKSQDKLSDNVGGRVNSGASATSLQLALENGKVAETADEYVRKLSGITAGKSNVIGYAFVINGEINSADVYASSDLFKKLWMKMLKASAIEAVAEGNKANAKTVKPDEVKGFLDEAENAPAAERKAAKGASVVTRDKKDVVLFESVDDRSKAPVHKSYVKKN